MLKKLISVLLLTPLLLVIEPVEARADCNNLADDIRMSDRLDETMGTLGNCPPQEVGRVARTYLLLGLAFYDGGEHSKALSYYTQAIEFAPGYVTAFANRGLSHAMNDDYKAALDDFERAIELDSRYIQAYYFRAFSHYREGKFRQALEDINTALTLTADGDEQATLYYNRARTYRKLRQNELALSDFNQAIELRPAFARAYFSRGLLHHQQKRVDAAIADYSRSIELDNQNARAYFHRGLLYRKAGTDFLAMRDFAAATEIDPAYARAYVNRGYTGAIPLLPLLFILALG